MSNYWTWRAGAFFAFNKSACCPFRQPTKVLLALLDHEWLAN
jgi:hypothetical protein